MSVLIDEINQEVQRRVAQQHGAVLFGAFERLKKQHFSGEDKSCNCEYCRALHRYVIFRLLVHRVKRRRYYEYPGMSIAELEALYEERLGMMRSARRVKELSKHVS